MSLELLAVCAHRRVRAPGRASWLDLMISIYDEKRRSNRALCVALIASVGATVGVGFAASKTAHAQQTLNTQQRQDVFKKTKSRIKVNRIKSGDLDTLGYKLMDGILVVPELRLETGYDSNHDQLFVEDSSGYGLVDGSLLFGYIQENKAVTLTFKGSYDRLGGLDREDRWDAGVSLDSYYRLNDNWEYTGGLFYLRDEVSYTQNETYSSYSQLDYTTRDLEAYFKSESYILRYIGETEGLEGISALDRAFFTDDSFNMRRHEISTGAVYRPHELVGIYSNGGFGISNYTDQPDESRLDRDANEFWLSGGFRLNLSPHLRAELGWRYNDRDIDDNRISGYDNNGFDAKVIWVPNGLLAVTYEADTFLAESAAAFSVVADVERHAITVALKPTARSTIDIYAAREVRKEIGSGLKYDEEKIAATYAYDVTATSQFYVTALFEKTEENLTLSDFERYRIGVGYRIKFVKNPGEVGEDVDLRRAILPGVQWIDTRIGYSKLHLPEMDMVTVLNPAFTQSQYHLENHDGEMDGARIDVRIPAFAGIATSPELDRFGLGNRLLSFNFAGYYAHYDDKQYSSCSSTVLSGQCAFFNIIDPQPLIENNTAPNGVFAIRTGRQVDTWGLAVETEFNGWLEQRGSLKDSEPVHRPHRPFRIGLAVKAIQQDTELFAYDTDVPDPVDYDEDLDTFYYGVYLGLNHNFDLGRGFSLGVNAEAGVYYADTQYKGNYLAFVDNGGGTYVFDRGQLSLSESDFSFIGSMRLELNKQIGPGLLGLYAEGEYYSFAPKMRYNDNDVSTAGVFSIFDITGPNAGTTIEDDDAYSYTIGGRFTIPLHQAP